MHRIAYQMSEAVQHRGPDDHGVWTDAEAGVALGFRRLSIIDLSPAGHQPMVSASGRFVVVFNGEIYNYESVRNALVEANLAPRFRGHSDTEVLLAAVEAWGLGEAVRRLVGMFAIAIWDRQMRRLHLVRDRLGVKPLYYGWMDGSFVFGSELKALRRYPTFNSEIDRRSLASLLRYNFVPAPFTIYRDVRKLNPGNILTLNSDSQSVEVQAYWSVADAVQAGLADPWPGTYLEAVGELDRLLRDSIALRMNADVPLGVFLSGGVDSSVVAALMQVQSNRPVRSFSIGFDETSYDEAPHAAAVAAHLGTDHTQMYVSSAEAMAVIPRLPHIFDEPFADSSQIPTFIVSELARRHVTVALSGDGGDELFGGYDRYRAVDGIIRRFVMLPTIIRRSLGRSLTVVTSGRTRKLMSMEGSSGLAGRVRRLAELLSVAGPAELYQNLVWPDKGAIALDAGQYPWSAGDLAPAALQDPISMMMFLDSVTYLPDDILVKVDRASMAASLEAREPLLDHRLVEFAWKLPLHMKSNGQGGKRILKEVLFRYVPRELVERPKRGFAVPVGSWLRGPLRPWAEELLDERRLHAEGYLDPKSVRRLWADHLNGTSGNVSRLWPILAFQSWLEE
jgi:asparagine synthase (glutamine-hydrolysing)